MPLESPSAYNMYLFNLPISNHILIKIFFNNQGSSMLTDSYFSQSSDYTVYSAKINLYMSTQSPFLSDSDICQNAADVHPKPTKKIIYAMPNWYLLQ